MILESCCPFLIQGIEYGKSAACDLGPCHCCWAAFPGALRTVHVSQVSKLATCPTPDPKEGTSAASLGDLIWK